MSELNLKTQAFEGPLDLLLALIAKNKLNILDIPIAEITAQYTEYIDGMRKLNPEIASEFITMAAELMLIKSRMLLPRTRDEEDPRKVLVDALLERKRAIETAAFLKLQGEIYFDSFTKEPDEADTSYEQLHSAALLREAFARMSERAKLLKEREKKEPLFTSLEDERYFTVEEKILYASSVIARGGGAEFDSLFEPCRTRSEVVALFLALLELLGRQEITVFAEGERVFIAPAVC